MSNRETQKDPDIRDVDFTADDTQLACADDTELKVATLRKGPEASLPPSADVPFNDLDMAAGTSDEGKTITLGDIEAAMVKKLKEALANGTIPQNTRGSSEIQ